MYNVFMKKMLAIIIIAVLLAVGGLVYLGPNFVTVELERQKGGVVVNPVYSVSVSGSGAVNYKGKLAKEIGEKSGTIKPAQARSLIIEFLKLNPLKLDSKYKSAVDNGAQPTKLTFQLLFYKKVIEFDEITAPTNIVNLAEKIDNTTNSKKWVFPEEF